MLPFWHKVKCIDWLIVPRAELTHVLSLQLPLKPSMTGPLLRSLKSWSGLRELHLSGCKLGASVEILQPILPTLRWGPSSAKSSRNPGKIEPRILVRCNETFMFVWKKFSAKKHYLQIANLCETQDSGILGFPAVLCLNIFSYIFCVQFPECTEPLHQLSAAGYAEESDTATSWPHRPQP